MLALRNDNMILINLIIKNIKQTHIETVKEIISGIRNIRTQKQIAQKEVLTLQVVGNNAVAANNAARKQIIFFMAIIFTLNL